MANRSEVDIIKAIDEALSELDEDSRKRVLDWANAKFLGRPAAAHKSPGPVLQSKGGGRQPTGRKRKGKGKVTVKQIKELDLRPEGKESAREFAHKKGPTNQKQKCVVALYYLLLVLGLEKAGIDHVYTVFKGVGWPAPADLLNTLHQAGSDGWLDTADSNDIKVTPIGENLVEHDLPKASRSQ